MPVQVSHTNGLQRNYPWGSWYETGLVVSNRDDLYLNVSTNPGGNNPFGVSHYSVEGARRNGDWGFASYVDVPTSFYNRPWYAGTRAVNVPDVPEASKRLQAATNPSRPEVLLPTFLFELRDLPKMVKQGGDLAIAYRDKGRRKFFSDFDTSSLGNANLAYQFGWRPFVQDIWKMLTFVESVEKRRLELNRLREKGGLRRRLKIDSQSGTYTTSDDIGITTTKWSVLVTGTQTWVPTYSGSADLTYRQVRRVLNGTSPYAITANVWEAMPWSWFTDYFIDIGSIIQAGNRSIATPGRGWITYDRLSVATNPAKLNSDSSQTMTTSEGTMRNRSKERHPAYFSTSSIAKIPFLNLSQLSILGSLAVVKNQKVLGIRKRKVR